MGTFVNTPASGGVDLSSLASGEAWLVGQVLSGCSVFCTGSISSNGSVSFSLMPIELFASKGSSSSVVSSHMPGEFNYTLDFSSIYSIDIRYYIASSVAQPSVSTTYGVYLQAQCRVGKTDNLWSQDGTHSYGTYVTHDNCLLDVTWTKVMADYLQGDLNSVNRLFVSQIYLSGSWTQTATLSVGVKITSYTTTDGKVHTSSNLNY